MGNLKWISNRGKISFDIECYRCEIRYTLNIFLGDMTNKWISWNTIKWVYQEILAKFVTWIQILGAHFLAVVRNIYVKYFFFFTLYT